MPRSGRSNLMCLLQLELYCRPDFIRTVTVPVSSASIAFESTQARPAYDEDAFIDQWQRVTSEKHNQSPLSSKFAQPSQKQATIDISLAGSVSICIQSSAISSKSTSGSVSRSVATLSHSALIGLCFFRSVTLIFNVDMHRLHERIVFERLMAENVIPAKKLPSPTRINPDMVSAAPF